MNSDQLTARFSSFAYLHALTIKLSILTLLFSSVFFVSGFASAAVSSIVLSATEADVTSTTPFLSDPVNAAGHENLVFSFSYDAEELDNGDSFSFGWISGETETELDSVDGVNEGESGSPTDEVGEISVELPAEAQVDDLELYIRVEADSEGDVVSITAMNLEGDEIIGAIIDGDEYTTLEEALVAAEDGDTVEVQAGVHEGFEISTPNVTVQGASGATVEGQITVSASGVTIDGLTVTNPTGGIGILVDGVGDVTISNNTVENIGSDSSWTNTSQGIYISDNNASEGISNIVIEGNTIDSVGNAAALDKTNKGIFVGDSIANALLDNLEIRENTISNIVANATDFADSGRGAYGVQINWGSGGAATGQVTNLVVADNTIEDLSGFWVHAIGLEADTPSAAITGNEIAGLSATKGTDGFSGDFRDEAGVFFEANLDAHTILVNDNEFSDMFYGVLLHPSLDLGENSVDATSNWWGDATGPQGNGIAVGEQITFSPWLDAPGGNERTYNAIVGGVEYFTIQDALDNATTTATVNVLFGTYNEQLSIETPLTLVGEGDDAETGTIVHYATSGTVLGISASDVTVEGLRIENEGNTGNAIGITGTAVNNLELDGITATGANVGLRVGNATAIDGLVVRDSHFDGNTFGWYFAKDNASFATVMVTNVSVDATSFNDNRQKGIYVEKLDNATFEDIEVVDSGTDATYGFNNGIDINLKYTDYENITIRNATISGSGLMGTATLFDPAGLTIKARDDASSYNAVPASLTGVTLDGLTISGGVVGVRFGEGNKSNLGPLNVTVENSRLSGTGGLGLENSSQATTTATHNYWGTSSTDADDIEERVSGLVEFDPWYLFSSLNVLSSAVGGNGEITPSGSDDLAVETSDNDEVSLPTGVTQVTLGNTAKLDLSAGLITVGNKKEVTLKSGTSGAPVVLKNASLITTTVTIPDGVKISGPSNWDGKIQPPRSGVASGNAPAGFSIGGTVISVGSENGTLFFDEAVTILLEGVTGAVGYKASGSDDWVEIDEQCQGTFEAPEDPTDDEGECHISNGVDTKIVTFHFTDFASVTPLSSGGGGTTRFAGDRGVVAAPSAEGVVLGASTYRFQVSMTIGSRGDAVIELQERLRSEGFFTFATSTGYFGPITQEAVKKYQAAHGIPSTGFVGPLTIASLNTEVSVVLGTDAQLNALRTEALTLMQQLVARLQAQLEATN